MTLHATPRPACEDVCRTSFLTGTLRRTAWKKEGFRGESTRAPFKQLVMGSRRNPGHPRAPIWRGRLLSGEALRVVQELKSAHVRGDKERLSQISKSKVARLVQFDLLAVFNELRRQNQCDLALLVFGVVQKEFWYKPDDGLRADLISTLAQNKRIEDIEKLYVSVSSNGVQESVDFYTGVMSAQVQAGNLQKARDVYDELKKVGHAACSPAFTILRDALVKNRDHELVETLDQEHGLLCGHDADVEREKQADAQEKVSDAHTALTILQEAWEENKDHELVATLDQEYRNLHGHDPEREQQVDASEEGSDAPSSDVVSEEREESNVQHRVFS